MTATMIIDEIKRLQPEEQAKVTTFVRSLDQGRPWSPEELSQAAARLVAETDPVKAQESWERIATGFYGATQNA